MKEETKNWLEYSKENLEASKVLLESKLFNACLQNIQQSVEKTLKSLMIEKDIPFKKTHSILELKQILSGFGILISLDDDDCDFFDSIYLPSKYPVSSVLPYFYPDEKICRQAYDLAYNLLNDVIKILS